MNLHLASLLPNLLDGLKDFNANLKLKTAPQPSKSFQPTLCFPAFHQLKTVKHTVQPTLSVSSSKLMWSLNAYTLD